MQLVHCAGLNIHPSRKEKHLADKPSPNDTGLIPLTLASNDYPFFGALTSGRHQAYGLDIRWHYVDPPNKLFRRVLKSPRYDVTELSLSSYTIMREQGWRAYKALPIFTSRRFRHSALFVRRGSRLVSGEQLKGKRVGVPDYHMTAAVWIRGILQDDYGVKPEDIRWVTGRVERVRLPRELAGKVENAGGEARLFDWLLEKKLDAVIYAHLTKPPVPDGAVRCLFPDAVEREKEYFRKHGVIPLMHLMAIREKYLEKGSGIARKVERVLRKEKEAFFKRLERVSTAGVLPWFSEYVDGTAEVLGPDPWPHGLEANRKGLEKFLDYSLAQGLISHRPDLRELFIDV